MSSRITATQVLEFYAKEKAKRERHTLRRIGHFIERVSTPNRRVPSPAERAAIASKDWWRALPPTDRQRAVFVDLGLAVPELRGQAHDMIREMTDAV